MVHWFSYLLIGYLPFYKSPALHALSTSDSQYSATALLNDSTWFGKAIVFKHIQDRPCTDKHFGLGISTDIPYSRGYHNRRASVTGCMNKCVPTQYLSFTGVPLKVGRHNLASLEKCIGVSSTSIAYELLYDGDVTAMAFNCQRGWIEVTKYKPTSKEIEGKFEASLISNEGHVARFSRGTFRAKLGIR